MSAFPQTMPWLRPTPGQNEATGMYGYSAGRTTYDFATNILCFILPIDRHVQGAVAPIKAKAQRFGAPSRGHSVGRVLPGSEQPEPDPAVQRARIYVEIPQPSRHEPGDRALTGRRGTIDRDRNTHAPLLPAPVTIRHFWGGSLAADLRATRQP